MSKFVYKNEYKLLTNACFNLTDACPLGCRYCFVAQKPNYMTLEVAKSATLYLLDNLEKKREIQNNPNLRASITYFGGEPTLLWDEIIVPLTTWVKENNYPIDFSITTNGVLLNEDRIKFMYDNKIIPLLSIDGDRETQEYNRPFHCSGKSSFDEVMKNVPILLKYFPDTTFRATIYAPTAHKTFENYMFAVKQGFKNIFMMPDCRHSWTEEQKEALEGQIYLISLYYMTCFEQNIEPINCSIIEDGFKTMLKLDLYPNEKLKRHRNVYHCGLGNSFGSIGWDGSIYGCQEQPSKKNNIFYIGNITKGINTKKQKKLIKKYYKKQKIQCYNKKKCKHCLIRKQCIADCCPSMSYDLYNKFFINSEIYCFWKEEIYKHCLALNNVLIKDNNEQFCNYLRKKCNFDKIIKGEK